MADSTVTITGNLTRDPELRYAPSGTPVLRMGVAVNRRFQRNGEWEDEVSFFDVVAFGTFGENVSDSVRKGDRVIVTGRLQQRSWETESGDKRYAVEVVADEIGASMRFATVVSTKVERGGERKPNANTAATTYDDGEEPF